MLTVQSATFGYGRKPVVGHVSMTLQPGEVVAVLGTNGAGKSTLVKTLLGGQALLSGHIDWHPRRPNPIAYLSQLTEFDRQFPMDVRALVASGAWGNSAKGWRPPQKLPMPWIRWNCGAARTRPSMSFLADSFSGRGLPGPLFRMQN